jgi:serine/threonine protein phosphatase PrpC
MRARPDQASRMSEASHAFADDPMLYRFAHATHRGLVREENEDTIAIDEDSGLALVADGMGGYNAGEVASGLAAEFLVTHLVEDLNELRQRTPEPSAGHAQRTLHALLRARIDGVNDAIIDAANRQPEFAGMGTTLALLLIGEDSVTTLHLGDSRIYRMRDGVLSLLTRDHSLLQEQLDAGVLSPGEARESINRNFVTRALGVDVLAEPEINEYGLVPGDLYLVCSDGLPDMLSDEEIFDLLGGDPVGDLDDDLLESLEGEREVDGRVAEPTLLAEVAGNLVDAANARGGRDNVSVVLVSVGWAREESIGDDRDGDDGGRRKRGPPNA